eukprot:Hpha_TRINITY_DN16394_c0_g3::TRINITY_DN16394_c0_g3_i1::g.58881::m.58881
MEAKLLSPAEAARFARELKDSKGDGRGGEDGSALAAYSAACSLLSARPNSGLRQRLASTKLKSLQLTELKVSQNIVADAAALGAAFGALPSLRFVDLSGCGVRDKGLAYLLAAVEAHSAVSAVDLSDNPLVTDDGGRQCVSFLRRKNILLRLEGCSLPRPTMRRVRERVAFNHARTTAGRSQLAAVIQCIVSAPNADEFGRMKLGEACAALVGGLSGGSQLNAFAPALAGNYLPPEAVAAQSEVLLTRAKIVGAVRGVQAQKKVEWNGLVDLLFESTDEHLARHKQEFRRENEVMIQQGSFPPPWQPHRSGSLESFVAHSAAPPADDPLVATKRWCARRDSIRGYLGAVVRENADTLLRAIDADGSISVKQFSEVVGLPVEATFSALSPFQLRLDSRVSLPELGRAFA